MTLRIMVQLTRKPELSHDEFVDHWRNTHAPLVKKVPHLKAYIQRLVLDDAHGDADAGVDGIAILEYANHEAYDLAWDSPEGLAALADSPSFVGSRKTIVFDDDVIVGA